MSSYVMLTLDGDSERIMIVLTKAFIQAFQNGFVLSCNRSVLSLLPLTFLLCFLSVSLSSTVLGNKGETTKANDPEVINIVPFDGQDRSAASVDFLITFSEEVTGVDINDFEIERSSELSGAVISNVTGSGADYTVTISGVPPYSDGILSVDLKGTGTAIRNLNGVSVPGFTKGEYHYVGKSFSLEAEFVGDNNAINNSAGFQFDSKFSPDGSKLFVLSSNKKIKVFNFDVPYSVETMKYAGVDKDFVIDTTGFVSLAFNENGTKLFLMQGEEPYADPTEKLRQYSLATGFDLSTEIPSERVVYVLDGSRHRHLSFSPDGLHMYVASRNTNTKAYEYRLKAPYDLSTIPFETSLGGAPLGELNGTGYVYLKRQASSTYTRYGGLPLGLAFTPDGKRMFGSEQELYYIFEYGMHVANDVRTRHFLNEKQFIQLGRSESVTFNSDGTKMLVVDASVNEFRLNTAPRVLEIKLLNTPTATATSVEFKVKFSAKVTGVDPNDFMLEASEEVKEATISSISGSGKSYTITVDNIPSNRDGYLSLKLKSSGTGIQDVEGSSVKTDNSPVNDYHYVGAAFDISKAVYAGSSESFSIANEEGYSRSLAFSHDGMAMFTMGTDSKKVTKYNLTVPYDISTGVKAGNDQIFSTINEENNPRSLTFNSSGKRMYIMGPEGRDVNEYKLTTAYDLSTVTFEGKEERKVISGQESAPTSVVFSRDGLKMFVLGTGNDAVQAYDLSKAFDVSTATHSGSRAVGGREANPYSIAFNFDGTKMFIMGTEGDDINEYTLATAYDVVNSVYNGDNQRFSVAEQETLPRSLSFNADGTKMYVLGNENNVIHEYNLDSSEPELISIIVADNPATDATTVDFIVTFDEIVTGLYNTDFELLASREVVGATVSGFKREGDVYTITVTNIPARADGTLGIRFIGNYARIRDVDGNSLIESSPSNEYHYVGAAFDISKAVHAGSQRTFTVTEESQSQARGLTFSSDGMKMFVHGSNSTQIHEYDLTVAFNASTAVYSRRFNAAKVGNQTAINFNQDGTRMILGGRGEKGVHQYNLTTGFDVSTAYYEGTSDNLSSLNAHSAVFNRNGTELIVMDLLQAHHFMLTTPYDIRTAVFIRETTPFSTEENDVRSLAFNADGTKAYITGRSKTSVYEYALTEAYNLATIQFSGVNQGIDLTPLGIINPEEVSFSDDGTKMFVLDNDNSTIHEYYMDSSPLDVVSINLSGNPAKNASAVDFEVTFSEAVTGVDVNDFELEASSELIGAAISAVSGSGTSYLVTVSDIPAFADGILSIDLKSSGTGIVDVIDGAPTSGFTDGNYFYAGVAFDVSKAVFSKHYSVASEDEGPRSIAFNPKGTKMFVMGRVNDAIYSYKLTTPYDVSTANFTEVDFSVAGVTTSPSSLAFNENGKRMFVLGPNGIVNEFKLTKAFDISTATLRDDVTPFSVREIEGDATSMTFSRDGRKLFVLGTGNDAVQAYDLTSPYEPSTAMHVGVRSVIGRETNPYSLAFNADGTKMYVLGIQGKDITEYSLPTPYDIASAVYQNDEEFSVGSKESAPRSLEFSPDGTKMFVMGTVGDRINEYNLQSQSVAGTIASSAPETVKSPFTVVFTFASSVTGFIASDITVVNGEASNLLMQSPGVYSALITPENEGLVVVSLNAYKAFDESNNGNEATEKISRIYDSVKPVFTSSETVNFIENGTGQVHHIKATDTNDVTLSLGSGNDENLFNLDGGILSFKNSPDFENPSDGDANNQYTVKINARDAVNIASQLVTISVTDLDETLPVFTSPISVGYAENIQETAYTIAATDEGALSFSLGNANDESLFKLEGAEVTFMTSPDFEDPKDGDANNAYVIEVLANDGLNTQSQLVVINVTNQDDTPPVFTSSTEVNFAENGIGTAYTVLATDANPLSYSLASTNDKNLFNINGNLISFKLSPDFENPSDFNSNNIYWIKVKVSDGVNEVVQSIKITVTNIDDTAPVFVSAASVDFVENATVSAYTIAATDANPLTYSLGNSNDEALFSLSQNVINFKTVPDFEAPADGDANNIYVVEVRATDGIQTVSQLLSISVRNLDDTPPVFTSINAVSFEENNAAQAYRIEATDVNTLSYSLGTGNDETLFKLEGMNVSFKTIPDFEQPVDADANNVYLISVNVTDGINEISPLVAITVMNVDDTPPVFISSTTASFLENATGVAYTISATDDSPLTYQLGVADDGGLFDLNGTDITFKVAPDFENPQDKNQDNVYSIKVKVNDGINEIFEFVKISVTNYDDVEPVFKSPSKVSFKENSSGIAYTIVAKDENSITYSLGSENDEHFFDFNKGVVRFKSIPDYEVKKSYKIEVRANDGLNTAKKIVTINIINVDEDPPVFTSPTTVDYVEAYYDIAYHVFSKDASDVSYSLGTENDESLFSLRGNWVFFKYQGEDSPDFENPKDADADNAYVIEVKASDGLNKEVSQLVTINVINRDETTPVITSSNSVIFAENGTGVVHAVMAHDKENVSDENPIFYSGGRDLDEGLFNINLTTGEIRFKEAPDFENPQDQAGNNTYLLKVFANDKTNHSIQQIYITVTDVEDDPPVFSSAGAGTFSENGTGIAYTAVATAFGSVTYSLADSHDKSLFDIVESTGEITFKNSPDFENPVDKNADNIYILNVKAGYGVIDKVQKVKVTVIDVDDTTPIISSLSTVSFAENGTGDVYTIVATDENSLTYQLGTGNDEAFFNLTGGVITFKTAPDFEKPIDSDGNNTYVLETIAFDGTNSAIKLVTITVNNVDDTAPVFTSPVSVSVSENSTGTIFTALATDANALVYSLGSDLDEGLFSINSGVITFKSAPDFEAPKDADANNFYKLKIIASDGLNTTAQFVDVTVSDLDEIAPSTSITSAANGTVNGAFDVTITFSENVTGFDISDLSLTNGVASNFSGSGPSYNATITPSANGTVVVNVLAEVAVDASGNKNAAASPFTVLVDSTVLSVSITSASKNVTNSSFDVSIVFSAEVSDFVETDLVLGNATSTSFAGSGTSYSVTIIPAVDGVLTIDVPEDVATNDLGTKNLAAGQFKILNDATSPVFTSSNTENYVENGSGTAYTAVATDDNALTYSLGTGNDEGLFTISESNGEVMFKAIPDFESPIDLDQNNKYSIQIIADDGINTGAQTVVISVANIDDTAPVFTSSVTTSFTENGVTPAYTIAATDANSLTYSFGSDRDEALFDLNSDKVIFKVAPDFESPTDSDADNAYIIEVKATDGIHVVSQIVTISVVNADDTAPVITSSSVAEFKENETGTVYTVVATDANVITYSLGNGSDAALFNITNGEVSFKTSPDFETPADADENNIYVIEVKASDGLNITAKTIMITVTNLDEVLPVFTSTTALNFVENGSETAYTISATDANPITYSLGSGNDEGSFNAFADKIIFKTTPDFEQKSSYVIEVQANDGLNVAKQLVSISITDIDESDPVFTSASIVNFNENGTGTIYTAVVTDDNAIAYSLGTENDEALFNLNNNLVSFKSSPDFENPGDTDKNGTYIIELKATDVANNVAMQLVTIIINDVDEIAPVFISSTAATFEENVAGVVYNAMATDESAITYSLGILNDEGLFELNNGQVSFKTSPDFESPLDADKDNAYVLELKATDVSNNVTSQMVTVTITDVDDLAPVFISPTTSTFIENETGIAYTAEVSDVNLITYNLGTANDESFFNLNGGEVSFKTSPDFEVKNSYVIEVLANDGPNTSKQTVTVSITDVDEISPVINSATAVNYEENGMGTVYNIEATDANAISYGLGTANDEHLFDLNGGAVTFKSAPDFEVQDSYKIEVRATDGLNTAKQIVSISIINIDEVAPVFTSATVISFVENGTGTAYTITATDANAVTYSLGTGNDEALFNLVGGVVTFKTSPDLETKSSYTIEVNASDGLNTASQIVAITITDVDEIPPVFTSATVVNFEENGTGTAYTIVATDANAVTYSLGTGNDETSFDITAGVITFKSSPDFESKRTYFIQVNANDGLNTAAQTVTITITDVDEILPVFTSATAVNYEENGTGTAYIITATDANAVNYSLGTGNDETFFSLTEGIVTFKTTPDFENKGSYVIEVQANDGLNVAKKVVRITITDVDEILPVFTSVTAVNFMENGIGTAYTAMATDANAISYGLGNSNDEAFFKLNGGVVTFKTSPDFESKSSYVIEVQANDGTNMAKQTVTINITDIDEILPVFSSTTTVEFTENGTGTAYTVSATGANNITYGLGTGNDEALFNLNGALLTFKTAPDFETKSNYVIEVEAKNGLNIANQTVKITIIDVDEIAPVLTSATAVDFFENGAGTAYTITATDANAISYGLGSGNDESLFNLDGSVITFKISPDYEVKSSYVIEIQANDGLNTSKQIVTITISDSDETIPVFTSAKTVNFAENGIGAAYTVTATDDNTLRYTLGTSNGEALFDIEGGEISFNTPPDFETKSSYTIEVKANDGLNEASQTVVITITDVDEVLPVFTSSTAVNFAENGTGTAYAIVATDANALTYSLGTGNDEALFDLVGGIVTFKSAPDFETKSTYTLKVNASDGLNTTSQTVTITITDVDEIAPVFTSTTAVNFAENGTGTAYTITATDANVLTYSLGTGNDEGLFNLSGDKVSFKASPDFEMPVDANADNAYLIEVIATDALGNLATQQVTITVTDADEVSPTVRISSASSALVFTPSFKVTFTFSEPVLGFDVSDLTITNGSATAFTGSGNTYSALITAATDGEVTVTVNQDKAEDASGNKNLASNTITRIVEATNVAPSAVDLSANTITENTAPPTEVGTLSATDADENDKHAFALVDGEGATDNALFRIINNKLIAKAAFDYETAKVASVRIRATDARGLSLDVIKQITVVNVAEPEIVVFIPKVNNPNKGDTRLTFKGTRTGQTATRTIEVTNSGIDGDLSITGITLPAGFTIDKTIASIAQGVKEVLTVTFSPTEEKVYAGSIVISSNAGEHKVQVGGKGKQNRAPIAVSPNAEVFFKLSDLLKLRGYDPDGDAIEFVITQQPQHGTITAAAGGLYSFTPGSLTPGQVYQDILKFKVVETGGGLESTEAELKFKFRVKDQTHSINSLAVSSKTEEKMVFDLNFSDPVLNDAYQLKVNYYDLSTPTSPVFVPLLSQSIAKSAITTTEGVHGFNFEAASSGNSYLFSASRVFMSVELTTANGYSASDGYILRNESSGASIGAIEGAGSEDGEFFVFASQNTVPENESVEVNLYAVELGSFSLSESTIAITKAALKGTSTSPVEVKKTDNLAQWKLTYASDTEIGLLDSLQFTVTHPGRSADADAYAKVEVIEVADAPELAAIADQQTNEEEAITLDLVVSDPDSELTITATSSESSNVPVTVSGNKLTITPGKDFNGTANISVLVTESNSESALSTFDEFQLTVVPVNDKPLMTAISDLTVAEDGQVVVTLSATDVDAELPIFTYAASADNQDNVSYTLEGDVLTISPAANYNGTIVFGVTANDGEGTANSISDSEAFTITVNAVNDAPTSSATINTQTLLEAIPAYTLDLTQYFTDIETAAKDLTYTVSSINNAGLSISGATLTITSVAGASGVEVATVTASDGELSVSQSVTFVATTASSEVTVANTVADQVLVEDFGVTSIDLSNVFALSTDANASFTYILTGNNTIGASMNGSQLELTSVDNFNGADELIIIGTADGKSSFTSFKITVSPANDAPSLVTAISDVSAPEDATLSQVISANAFSDVDGDVLSYSASYTAAWLSFDATTRTFSGTPANSDVGTVAVTMTATDPSGASATDSFNIVVSNTNDDPTAITFTSKLLNENIALSTVVSDLTSVDPDTGDDSFTYTLVSGTGDTDNSNFTIVGNQLMTASTVDFESKASYSIRVKTTDGFEGSFTEAVTLTVNNVNEVATDIDLPVTVISENQAAGSVISTLATTDPDTGDSHSYSLVSGTGDADNSSFTITDGKLTAASAFDFEMKSSYAVRVKTTDAGGLSFEKAFAVTVTNVNEAATDVSLSAATIAENASISTKIADLVTTDPDAGDSHVYSLATGDGDADNANFKIEGTKLLAASSFNFENRSSYSLRLKSTDAAGLSFEKSFTVTVTDVNDAPSGLSADNLSIEENQDSGTTIGSLTTTDQDSGDTHSYSLVAGEGDADNASFTLDGNVLKAAASYDFETKNSYAVRIKTTDAAGLSFEVAMTVSITNQAEAQMRVENNASLDPTGLGATATFNITVFNDGDGAMNVTGITYPEGFSGASGISEIAPSSSAELTITFSPTEAKTYSGNVVLTYNGGEQSVAVVATGEVITAIDDGLIDEALIQMYPNPATNEFTLDLSSFNGQPIEISIVNGSGVGVYLADDIRTNKHTVRVSSYSQGIYIVMLRSAKQLIQKKLVIRR